VGAHDPASTNYNFMQEPLLTEEVWIAFDHVARLGEAFNQRPDDFVAFPAPAGPEGRAFMPVLAGVAVMSRRAGHGAVDGAREPTCCARDADRDAARHELLPGEGGGPARRHARLGAGLRARHRGDDGRADALPALLPMGLGDMGGQFNQVYTDTFEQIVLGGRPVQEALDAQAERLRALMVEAGAPCWAPDEPSDGPCPVN
jgi:multiple sugar transport system substrate-binding protein